MHRYKVLPFIGRAKGNLSADVVSKQLEDLISAQATEGWEFYQLSNVNIQVTPGCLAGLLGGKESYVRYDQVIFRKGS